MGGVLRSIKRTFKKVTGQTSPAEKAEQERVARLGVQQRQQQQQTAANEQLQLQLKLQQQHQLQLQQQQAEEARIRAQEAANRQTQFRIQGEQRAKQAGELASQQQFVEDRKAGAEKVRRRRLAGRSRRSTRVAPPLGARGPVRTRRARLFDVLGA